MGLVKCIQFHYLIKTLLDCFSVFANLMPDFSVELTSGFSQIVGLFKLKMINNNEFCFSFNKTERIIIYSEIIVMILFFLIYFLTSSF